MFDTLFGSLIAKAAEMDLEKLAVVCVVAIVIASKGSKESNS